jgi:hypothetical protein
VLGPVLAFALVGGLLAPVASAADGDSDAAADGPVSTKVHVGKLKVGYMKTLAHNGYQQFPDSMTVSYRGQNLSPDDYHITLGKNTKVGKGTFTIHGEGAFTGKKTFTFRIKKLSKGQREKLARAEAKRLAKLIPKSVTNKRDKIIIAYQVIHQAIPQFNQSSKAYKKNFGNEAYANFALGTAACSGQTRALIMLAKAAGLKAKHVNAKSWTHQWASIDYGTKAKPKRAKVDPQQPLDLGSYVSKIVSPPMSAADIQKYFPVRWGSVTNWKKPTPYHP